MKRFYSFIIMGILMMNSSTLLAQQANFLCSYKAGNMEITMLSDSQQNGRASILLGATPEMLQKAAPDGTFPNATSAFLVRISDKTILVDTGLGTKLFDHLKTLGVEPSQIDAVLITHMHGDHFGGLLKDDKAAFPNATLYISQMEYDCWCNPATINNLPENRRSGAVNAQKAVAPYRLQLFSPQVIGTQNTELFHGITAFAAYGHTPGHTIYLFESKGEKLLVWGDLTHAMAIQMPYPQVAVTYDSNPQEAVASRLKVLEFASKNNILIAGMHIAYPAMGYLSPNGAGGYLFTPITERKAPK